MLRKLNENEFETSPYKEIIEDGEALVRKIQYSGARTYGWGIQFPVYGDNSIYTAIQDFELYKKVWLLTRFREKLVGPRGVPLELIFKGDKPMVVSYMISCGYREVLDYKDSTIKNHKSKVNSRYQDYIGNNSIKEKIVSPPIER